MNRTDRRQSRWGTEPDAERSVQLYVLSYAVIAMLIFFSMGGYLPWNAAHSGTLAGTVDDSGAVSGQLFQACMWLMACGLMARYLRDILRMCWETKAMTLLCLLAPASALWSQNPANSFRRGIFLCLGTVLAHYLVRRFPARELAQMVVLSGVIAGLMGVVASLIFPQIGRDAFNGGAWQGVFRSKNGSAQVMLFFATAAFTFKFSSQFMGAMRLLLIGIAFVLIAMSNAKTAWLLTPGYLLLMSASFWVKRFRRRDALVLVLAGAIALVVMASATYLLMPLVLELMGKSPEMSGRVPLWGSVIVSILKRPLLGYGFASFWTGMQGESLNIFMSTRFAIFQAQNGILEIWLELGLVGVVLVVLTFVGAIRDALTCFQPGHAVLVNWYGGIIALTICYNIDETFLASPHLLPWLLYVVACSGLAAEAKRTRSTSARIAAVQAGRRLKPNLASPQFAGFSHKVPRDRLEHTIESARGFEWIASSTS